MTDRNALRHRSSPYECTGLEWSDPQKHLFPFMSLSALAIAYMHAWQQRWTRLKIPDCFPLIIHATYTPRSAKSFPCPVRWRTKYCSIQSANSRLLQTANQLHPSWSRTKLTPCIHLFPISMDKDAYVSLFSWCIPTPGMRQIRPRVHLRERGNA